MSASWILSSLLASGERIPITIKLDELSSHPMSLTPPKDSTYSLMGGWNLLSRSHLGHFHPLASHFLGSYLLTISPGLSSFTPQDRMQFVNFIKILGGMGKDHRKR